MKANRIVLLKRPIGMPNESVFGLESTLVSDANKENELPLHGLYYSVYPYMRGRMNAESSKPPAIRIVTMTKANCPVSRLFSAKVNLHTEFVGQHPGSNLEAEVVIYTSNYCQVCGEAKKPLESKGIRYREVDLDVEAPEVAEKLKQKTGRMSVPQIFIGSHFIGSYDDLIQLDADQGLKPLLQPGGDTQVAAIGLSTSQFKYNSKKTRES